MLKSKKSIAVVAEPSTKDPSVMSPNDCEADAPSMGMIDNIISALTVSFQAEFIELADFNPKSLTKNEIVFPLWQGGISRNRTAFIPSICEMNGLRYVGADAFVQSACQDKHATKLIANSFGLTTPKGVIIYSPTVLKPLHDIRYPAVIKPLYGGTSVGITQRNLCQSAEEAIVIAKDPSLNHLYPLIVEEFIYGEEYYLSVILNGGRIKDYQAVAWLDQCGNSFLDDKIFDFDLKVRWTKNLIMTDKTSSVPAHLLNKVEKICEYFRPIDIIRFDFRAKDDDFVLIEITPDMSLAFDAEFVGGFRLRGMNESDVFKTIIQATEEKYLAK